MTAWALGVRLGAARLGAGFAAAALGVAALIGAGVGNLERASDARHAVDHALLGGAFGATLPLAAWIIVGRVLDRGRIDAALHPLAAHGAHRRGLLLGLGAVASCLSALVTLFAGGAALWFAHGVSGGELLRVAAASATGGVAYTCALFAASSFGSRTGWRGIWLVADWWIGGTGWVVAAAFPRGHLASYLGGGAVASLPQRASLPALCLLAVLGLGIALRRTPP